MANFIPTSSLFELLRQQQAGGLPPEMLAELIRRRNLAPQLGSQGPQPVPEMAQPQLPGAGGPMPLRLPPSQGAQATLNPPDYRNLTNREIFGPGLAQGFAAASQRPVRSLAEAVGNIGSAFMAAPGLALEQKQQQFYDREAQRAAAAEQRQGDERQALEDAQAQRKFADYVRDRTFLESERKRQALEREEAEREEEDAAKSAAQARARRKIAAEPFYKEVDGDIGAEGALDAWVEDGEEKHSKAAQKAIERVRAGGKVTTQPIPGTNTAAARLPDGRWISVTTKKGASTEGWVADRIEGIPWEAYGITSPDGGNYIKARPEGGGPDLQVDIPRSLWEKAKQQREADSEAEAVEFLSQSYIANGGTYEDYREIVEAGRDPRLEGEKRRREGEKLNEFLEGLLRAEESRVQAENELRRRRIGAGGLGTLAPARHGEASMGSMSAQTDTRALSSAAETLMSLPAEQVLRRLSAGRKDRYDELSKRLKELRMLGVTDDREALITIIKEFRLAVAPARYGGQ